MGEGEIDRFTPQGLSRLELLLNTPELTRGDVVYRVPATAASWASPAPWVLVIAIIVIVVGMRPDPASIGSCLLLLAWAGKAYRGFSR